MSISINISKTLDSYSQRPFHSDKKQISGFQWTKRKAKREETLGVVGMFTILIAVSFMDNLYVKSVRMYQIAHFKYMQLSVIQ